MLLKDIYQESGKTDYSRDDINLYVKLDNRATLISKIKLGVVVVFTMIAIFGTVLREYITPYLGNLEWDSIPNFVIFPSTILIAILLHFILGYLIHCISYYLVEEKKHWYKETLKFKIGFLLFPDYLFALRYKKIIRNIYENNCVHNCSEKKCYCIKDRDKICINNWDSIKIKTKYFVQFSNWLNLILNCLIGIITICLWGYEGWIINIILYIVILRVISRFYEIAIAFYKDVVRVDDKFFVNSAGEYKYIHRWKNSLILKSGRISLAIHSLIEVVILYSILYYFLSLYLFELNNVSDLIGNNGQILNYFHFLFVSTAVSAMNYSYTSFPHILWNVTHLSQVFLSLVLIVLSIASYLGLNGELDDRDEKFYIETHKELNGKINYN